MLPITNGTKPMTLTYQSANIKVLLAACRLQAKAIFSSGHGDLPVPV